MLLAEISTFPPLPAPKVVALIKERSLMLRLFVVILVTPPSPAPKLALEIWLPPLKEILLAAKLKFPPCPFWVAAEIPPPLFKAILSADTFKAPALPKPSFLTDS